jgi:predicted TIM-barrel fold metal-dependent hydrolase
MGHSRPISNYLAAVTCDRLFERFPNVRIASVENGADCLPLLTAGLRRAGRQRPGYFKSDPLEQFREHVWIAPFWEDDIDEAIEYIGADRVLFGSDWPHVEGLKNPRDYESIVEHLGADDRQAIMYANCAELTGLGVTVSRV